MLRAGRCENGLSSGRRREPPCDKKGRQRRLRHDRHGRFARFWPRYVSPSTSQLAQRLLSTSTSSVCRGSQSTIADWGAPNIFARQAGQYAPGGSAAQNAPRYSISRPRARTGRALRWRSAGARCDTEGDEQSPRMPISLCKRRAAAKRVQLLAVVTIDETWMPVSWGASAAQRGAVWAAPFARSSASIVLCVPRAQNPSGVDQIQWPR